ncbi:MAG: hemolysin [Acidimicrobiales bacterium]|nr:hemolysin [Acidimicrobiales bacterium]
MVKPLLRGRLHVGAFAVSVPAAVALVALAGSPRATVAAAVYGVSLVALFGASGAYHRLGHRGGGRPWMRQADHASIYGLIAGSYTPVALVAIGGWFGWTLLIGVWAVAALGALMKLVWFDRTQVAGWVLYIGLGWVAVSAIPSLVAKLDPGTLILLAAGGVAYTFGAAVLGRRWPDPLPRVFGYHEVWHSLVIVAAALHFLAILAIVRAG